MFRLTGHSVISPKSAWCGDVKAKIVPNRPTLADMRNGTATTMPKCSNCGQIAVKW